MSYQHYVFNSIRSIECSPFVPLCLIFVVLMLTLYLSLYVGFSFHRVYLYVQVFTVFMLSEYLTMYIVFNSCHFELDD